MSVGSVAGYRKILLFCGSLATVWQKRRHLSGNGMSVGSVADPDLYYVKKFESGSVWRDNKSGSRPYTVNEQKHAMAKRVGGLLITFKLTTDKLITKIYKLITYKKLFL